MLNNAAFEYLERRKADPALVAKLETREPQLFANQLQFLTQRAGQGIDIFDKPLFRYWSRFGGSYSLAGRCLILIASQKRTSPSNQVVEVLGCVGVQAARETRRYATSTGLPYQIDC